jgi:hypothetical protein
MHVGFDRHWDSIVRLVASRGTLFGFGGLITNWIPPGLAGHIGRDLALQLVNFDRIAFVKGARDVDAAAAAASHVMHGTCTPSLLPYWLGPKGFAVDARPARNRGYTGPFARFPCNDHRNCSPKIGQVSSHLSFRFFELRLVTPTF